MGLNILKCPTVIHCNILLYHGSQILSNYRHRPTIHSSNTLLNYSPYRFDILYETGSGLSILVIMLSGMKVRHIISACCRSYSGVPGICHMLVALISTFLRSCRDKPSDLPFLFAFLLQNIVCDISAISGLIFSHTNWESGDSRCFAPNIGFILPKLK